MKTKHLHGNTAFNNQLTLPEGALAVDLEKKALRFHMEGVQGGFECVGVRAFPVGPGPEGLIAGDLTTGFYGEVGPDEFISYSELSSLVGLSAGNLQTLDRQIWLKFSLDNIPANTPKEYSLEYY